MLKKRFFIYRPPTAAKIERESLTRIYRPHLEIRDRETLVPNPDAPKFKMYAVVETGLKYLDAYAKTLELNSAV